ncbi:hypothetical protein ACJRPK_06415 [Aquimarina sp. 2-A2]|uniref:hypothetical protein n=1 Tax=Aquimarina sp. 2-A2 TaxID=3382644 RepID=UPI00387F2DE6
MKLLKIKIVVIISLLFCLTSYTSVLAQCGSCWGQNSNYGKLFNPQTLKTLTGTVVAVERIMPNKNMSYGLHLKVKTEDADETISVHLGPTWYLDNQEIQFSTGNKITVKGSEVSYNNEPAIIATEVKRNDYTLTLRNDTGYPVWSGWRKKGMRKGSNR